MLTLKKTKESTEGGSPALRREGRSAKYSKWRKLSNKKTRNVESRVFLKERGLFIKPTLPINPS